MQQKVSKHRNSAIFCAKVFLGSDKFLLQLIAVLTSWETGAHSQELWEKIIKGAELVTYVTHVM